MSREVLSRLTVAQGSMTRSMSTITSRDRKNNEWLKERTGMEDVGTIHISIIGRESGDESDMSPG